MPPVDAKALSDSERKQLVRWIAEKVGDSTGKLEDI
jgi:hypothetical protein